MVVQFMDVCPRLIWAGIWKTPPLGSFHLLLLLFSILNVSPTLCVWKWKVSLKDSYISEKNKTTLTSKSTQKMQND